MNLDKCLENASAEKIESLTNNVLEGRKAYDVIIYFITVYSIQCICLHQRIVIMTLEEGLVFLLLI